MTLRLHPAGRRRARWLVSLSLAVTLAPLVVTGAAADVPFPTPPAGGAQDYASYLFLDSGDCGGANDLPENFDCEGDWKYTDDRADERPDHALLYENPQELYGVKGTGLNRAWEISTGRPDVVIAVLDSGIRWEEDQPGLLRKYYLNRAELPLPQAGPADDDERFDGYDVNGDGLFNVEDYDGDDRVRDFGDDQNDVVDPADLIRVFSDGVDDDGNGYIDDISGWDFFEDDNNPLDDVDYGHGTGEANDSTAEAGDDADGQCPNCMMMTMRVGDSFVADVNHFADAVVYATDNGASVIQEALGTLNHTSYGQSALDHAYENGVIVNASEADEAAAHHNWPAAYDHTMVVNSIRTPSVPVTQPQSYLYLNGCTNFGGYTYVSIPSTSCSSEATGRSAGVSGLLYSAALNAIDRGAMTPYVRDDGSHAPFALSAEEAMQLWRLSADDIDFSSPCEPGAFSDEAEHAFCDDSPDGGGAAPPNNYAIAGSAVPSTRYQTVKGWDFFTGYGRNNAARLLRYIGIEGQAGVDDREYVAGSDGALDPFGYGADPLSAQERIPPEADIVAPRFWRQYAYDDGGALLLPDDPEHPDQVVVTGRAAANRVTSEGGTFDYVLEWAPHVQGALFPLGVGQRAADSEEDSPGPWTEAARGEGLDRAYEGELGRIDVADLAAALESTPNPFLPPNDPTAPSQPERYGIRLRLRVIAHPTNPDDTVNNEAVRQKQIDVYPADEVVVRDDLGVDGRYAGGSGSPSTHDIDGDGVDELLVTSDDGVVHAYTDLATGEELPGWPVTTLPYSGVERPQVGDGRTRVDNAYTRGDVVTDVHGGILQGTVAVADLDDDGAVEVLAADLEGYVYAWQPDGSLRPGFPLSVDRTLSAESDCGPSTIPACDDFEGGAPKRDEWNERDWGINAPPSVGDLDPMTPGLEIVSGANDGHVYAWHEDGTPVEGWPVVLRDPATVATMDPRTRFWCYGFADEEQRTPECAGEPGGDVTPAIGTKVIVTPSLGDIDGDGDLEVVVGVNEEYVETPNASAFDDPIGPVVGQVADGGNTRLYALHHTGAATPETEASRATAHTHDQAYVDGWPVPLAMLVTGLLPYVGEGTNSQSALGDVDGDGAHEIAIASAAGPAYLLRGDGSSYLGNGPDGRYRTYASNRPRYGPLSNALEPSTFVGVGQLAIGSMDGSDRLTVIGPGAGLIRLLDILLEADQVGAEDHILLWDAATGQFEDNAPLIANDLQFFTQPTIADVTGDGHAEALQGTAVNDTVVAGLDDTSESATRYHTGGWTVSSANVGPTPLGAADDGTLGLSTTTREGYLRVYATAVESTSEAACTALREWPEYGHDPFNSGAHGTDAIRPDPLTNVTVETSGPSGPDAALSFTATGDDRTCGSADHYEARFVRGPVGAGAWLAGHSLDLDQAAPTAPGTSDGVVVQDLPSGRGTILVRAYDDAGNGSALAAVAVGAGAGTTGTATGSGTTATGGGSTSGSTTGSAIPTTGGGLGVAAAVVMAAALARRRPHWRADRRREGST